MLALLPVVGSPFQARFTGPHTVVKQTSEENYLISTPNRRRKTQLCHGILLKPYFFCGAEQGVLDAHFEGVQPAALANTVLSSMSQSVAEAEREEPRVMDQALLSGRLKNTLKNLDDLLGHLSHSRLSWLS